jgi:hypothetical protein
MAGALVGSPGKGGLMVGSGPGEGLKEQRNTLTKGEKRMKKIGLLCLALVLALGALGVGYAAWTDTIFIEGTVNTGTLDLVVEEYSGMWMWKLPNCEPDYYLSYDPLYDPTIEGAEPFDEDGFLVAYAEAAQTMEGEVPVDDSITVTFDNIFPLVEGEMVVPWTADFVCHYVGSIPVKVMLEEIVITPDAGTGFGTLTTNISGYIKRSGDEMWAPITNEQLEGIQLHYCDRVAFVIEIWVPQYESEDDNAANMGLSGEISGKIKVIQWNEYPTGE